MNVYQIDTSRVPDKEMLYLQLQSQGYIGRFHILIRNRYWYIRNQDSRITCNTSCLLHRGNYHDITYKYINSTLNRIVGGI